MSPDQSVTYVPGLNRAGSWKLGARSWKLEARSWKLEAGSWELEAGSWKLEAGSWKLGAVSWELRGSRFCKCVFKKRVYDVRVSSSTTRSLRNWQAGELFTVTDAAELYEVQRWGKGYFSVSS